MNASVLLVGDAEFSACLCHKVRGLSAMVQWRVDDADAALDVLKSNVPEVMLLQATQTDNWEICHYLKQQRRLALVYCILLDERICPTTHTSAESLLRQNGLTTAALEAGADAYIWISDLMAEASQESTDYLNRLIQAHFRTAHRRMQCYRELTKQNDLLSSLALVDPLTQLANRRAFDWELPRQIQNSRNQRRPLSLLILDIDYFKQVNDDYGHLVGDQVLRMFAERLCHQMRFYETPFRYGGEEFVVILQDTSAQEAEKVAERLRRLIDDTPFMVDADLDLAITVSIGVATLIQTDDFKGIDLFGRADSNLLKAKSAGRNRVIISEER